MATMLAPQSGKALSPAEADGIYCDNLVKIYKVSTLEVVALQGLNLQIDPGEMVGIVGKSGSGKSTLLNILGGNDLPSAGKVRVAGKDLLRLGDREMTRYRRFTVGFIWQQTARNLLPYASARRNIEHVLLFAGVTGAAARKRADELLDMVGLGERKHNKPYDLSGGEQQRVAIAVALANRPKVILADEPTGELDNQTAADILGVLKTLNKELAVTTVVVTHDPRRLPRPPIAWWPFATGARRRRASAWSTPKTTSSTRNIWLLTSPAACNCRPTTCARWGSADGRVCAWKATGSSSPVDSCQPTVISDQP